jgi:hypothetical protein
MREPLSHGGYAAGAGLEGIPYLTSGDADSAYEEVWKRVLSLDPLMGRRWLTSQSSNWLQRAPFWPARLLIKEINCPLALDWLSVRFPMTFIVTVRHPCGYVASGLRLQKVGHQVVDLGQLLNQPRLMAKFSTDEQEWLKGLTDPVAKMAAAYGIVYKLLGKQLLAHPEWILVHHESICLDPTTGFNRLCEATQLRFNRKLQSYLAASSKTHDDELYSLNRISAEQPEKWKTELTTAEIDTIAAVIARFRLKFYRDFV